MVHDQAVLEPMSQDNSTTYKVDDKVLISTRKEFIFLPQCPVYLCSSTSLYSNGLQSLFPQETIQPEVQAIPPTLAKLKMCSLPPCHHTSPQHALCPRGQLYLDFLLSLVLTFQNNSMLINKYVCVCTCVCTHKHAQPGTAVVKQNASCISHHPINLVFPYPIHIQKTCTTKCHSTLHQLYSHHRWCL